MISTWLYVRASLLSYPHLWPPPIPILGEVGLAIDKCIYTLSDVINGHITDRKFGSQRKDIIMIAGQLFSCDFMSKHH